MRRHQRNTAAARSDEPRRLFPSKGVNSPSSLDRFLEIPNAPVRLMNTLKRHLQHGPGLHAPGVVVVLGRIQQHPHQVDGVVEMLERPADVPGVPRAASGSSGSAWYSSSSARRGKSAR